jgi:hypothetical protein
VAGVRISGVLAGIVSSEVVRLHPEEDPPELLERVLAGIVSSEVVRAPRSGVKEP